jgi:uncharacterized protein DUF7010
MTTKYLTRNDLENTRAEVFHMILFGLAWVMIGEFTLDFSDYVVPAVLMLTTSVLLGVQSIHIYELEDELPDPEFEGFVEGLSRKNRFQLYVIIFLSEAVAIMATWIILLGLGHPGWLVPGFAFIAGLHFFPLASIFKLKRYYLLGAWVCLLAAIGYLTPVAGQIPQASCNSLIAYGCAAGAISDGIWVIAATKKTLRTQRFRILMRRFP